MQTRPDHPTLLDALARFLLEDVSATLEHDKALQFRVLISANLASMVANELRSEPKRLEAEVQRLAALLPDVASALPVSSRDREQQFQSLDALNRALVTRLEAGSLSTEQLAQTFEVLYAAAKDTLAVTNPRFDLSDEV